MICNQNKAEYAYFQAFRIKSLWTKRMCNNFCWNNCFYFNFWNVAIINYQFLFYTFSHVDYWQRHTASRWHKFLLSGNLFAKLRQIFLGSSFSLQKYLLFKDIYYNKQLISGASSNRLPRFRVPNSVLPDKFCAANRKWFWSTSQKRFEDTPAFILHCWIIT